MLPTDLVLVRHGQSHANLAIGKSRQGDHSAFSPEFRQKHTSGIKLTELGREQATKAGELLISQFYRRGGNLFDRHYVSEYKRAKETAALLGLPDARWYCEPYLAERDWGELDNLPENERQENFGRSLKMRKVEPFFWRPPNGESFSDLCLRVDRMLDTLHRECSEDRVVMVCHGEVMRAFQIRLERLSQQRFRELAFSRDSSEIIQNCQINHYTRRCPRTGQLYPYIGWVKWYRQSVENSVSMSEWISITREAYSNEDLLEMVGESED